MTLARSDLIPKGIHDPSRGHISAVAANDSRQFIGTAENVHFHGEETQFLDDSHLPCARNARYNALADSEESPCCLEGTRVQILRDIDDWVNDRGSRSIFWLSGLAGTGKTAIARTVAHKYDEKSRLGASFFFPTLHSDTRCATSFVTTIGRQLADADASLRDEINRAIRQRRHISSYALEDQWRHLILGPLARAKLESARLPYVLVIDGLEECKTTSGIATVLRLLSQTRTLGSKTLRVLLTSRPDTRIEAGFVDIPEDMWRSFKLHSLDNEVVDDDIRNFLTHRFKRIAKTHQQANGWPGTNTIDILTRKAGGLFIWATTACRFVGSDSRFSQRRLLQLLNDHISIDDPTSALDKIYLNVLQSTVAEGHTAEEKGSIYEIVRLVLGAMSVLVYPLPITDLVVLLQSAPRSYRAEQLEIKSIDAREVHLNLKHLSAIVDVPEEENRSPRLHHPALRQFLFDPARCKEHAFHVKKRETHLILAGFCVSLMSQSWECRPNERGNFGLEKSYDPLTDRNPTGPEQRLQVSLRYACLYWVHHLQQSGATLHENDSFHHFVRKHVIHWVKALISMEKIPDGLRAVSSLEEMTFSHNVCAHIRDAKRSLLYPGQSLLGAAGYNPRAR
ncbi:ATP-binding protein [Aspergillus affinis]|uniref:ATP-binding protein n=1 Tax=Aspergillus affinis TaxID=1070780 RepID=UPI0022FE8B89|nr:uncharacterized protein KD926_005817 [Aspergillus affinis]KAI9045874.1 hypothetical protein KD926_005817 [Aspergillus affinis]